MLVEETKGPYKIILCSGPRGGKSVIANKISEWFSDSYNVFILSETARELFDSGLLYEDNPYYAQKEIIRRQLIKESNLFKEINSKNLSLNKTIIVFDRTCIDAGTFLTSEDFNKLLAEEKLTQNDIAINLHNSFVIHLQSLAVTRPKYYEKRNKDSSIIRRESAQEAALSDEKIYFAYKEYTSIFKKHILIPPTKNINEKAEIVKNEITKFLNE